VCQQLTSIGGCQANLPASSVSLFCVYIWLFHTLTGLFCVYIGLFHTLTGLFCVYIGLFHTLTGLFVRAHLT
jgi:hypothetical protein